MSGDTQPIAPACGTCPEDDVRPGGLSSCGSSPSVSPVPASIPDAGIAGKKVCATCFYSRTFKPRKDEQARFGFGDTGWECRKQGYEGYTTPFSGCAFHRPTTRQDAPNTPRSKNHEG